MEAVLKLDEDWKKELKIVEELKHKRNVVSEEINKAKKEKKRKKYLKIQEMKKVAEQIKEKEYHADELLHQRNKTLKK